MAHLAVRSIVFRLWYLKTLIFHQDFPLPSQHLADPMCAGTKFLSRTRSSRIGQYLTHTTLSSY